MEIWEVFGWVREIEEPFSSRHGEEKSVRKNISTTYCGEKNFELWEHCLRGCITWIHRMCWIHVWTAVSIIAQDDVKGRIFQSSNMIGLVTLHLFSKMTPCLYFTNLFIKNIGRPFWNPKSQKNTLSAPESHENSSKAALKFHMKPLNISLLQTVKGVWKCDLIISDHRRTQSQRPWAEHSSL